MDTLGRIGVYRAIAMVVIALALASTMFISSTHVGAQGEPTPTPIAHMTLVLNSGGNDTVSWSDPDSCSSDYNLYRGYPKSTTRYHLGSAPSGSTEATFDIFATAIVELYCGAYDPESSDNELIAVIDTHDDDSYQRGTYSTAPLTALSVSSGTLSPAFDRGIGIYAAEVPSGVGSITLTATALRNPSWAIVVDGGHPRVYQDYEIDIIRNPSNPSSEVLTRCSDNSCTRIYGDGETTGIVLSDADTETEGFQVNLGRGENQLGIGVHKGNEGINESVDGGHIDIGTHLYYLTVTVQHAPATGQPTISGTAQVDRVLTADTSGISDVDGLTNVSYNYQWLSSRDVEINGATSSTYTVQESDKGKGIKVRVTFTDDAGYDETLTSAPTGAVVAGNAPTISGAARVGQVLTASTSGISDADGLTNVAYTYQWLADDAEISGATSSSYTLTTAEQGKTIKVKVFFDDDEGNAEQRTSAATAAVAAAWAVPGVPGSLTVSVNDTGKLDLSWDAPGSNGGSAVTSYKVQWKETTDSWDTPADVSEATATGTTYTVSGLTDGTEYTFRVTAVNSVGDSDASNEATGTPRETTAPTVSSALVDGTTLTITFSEGLTETPAPATTTFTVTVGGNDRGVDAVTVSGSAVALTLASAVSFGDQVTVDYTVPTDQAAARLRDLASNAASSFYGQQVTNASGAIPATGSPTISGTAQVGQVLTADTSGIADADGLTNVSYSYQWIHSDGTDDRDIVGATGATYAITPTDVDKAIKLRVNFTDDGGKVESLTSSATVTVPVEVVLTFSIDGKTVTCDFIYYDVHTVCEDPTSTEQGESDEIELEIEIERSVNSQSYKFEFRIIQLVDSLGQSLGRQANDFCLGSGMADSALIEVTPDDGTGNFTYADDGTIFELCPAGTFSLHVYWYRYNNTDQEYEYAGTFRRYFFITSDDEVDESIEKVRWITALYPDPPVSHGDVQIEATREPEFLNRGLTKYSLSIGGLVPDSDTETTDYVVRLQVLGNARNGDRREVLWCHIGNLGYSYQLKTVPENGVWAMEVHLREACLTHWFPDTLQIELFDGTDLNKFIAGKDITLDVLPNSVAAGAPTISGTFLVGGTLFASTTGISDTNGLTNVSYNYQWISNDGTSDSDIQGATSSTYTLGSDDLGKTIKVKVFFDDDEGNAEQRTSAATAAVAAAWAVPGVPGSLTVSVNDTGKLDLSWDAPGSNGGSAVTSYKVQWKETTDSWDTPADVSEATATGTTYTVSGLTDGTEYTFRVTAVNSVGDSDASNEATGTPRETTAPTVSSASVDGTTLTITFSEGLTETPLPAATTFTVNVGDHQRGVNSVAISGSTVTLTLASAAISTDAVTVSYTVPSSAAAARLKDLSDNSVASFAARAVTNNTAAARTPLTASIHSEPASHDGQAEFTFELRFSENLEGFSYRTLRDHAFTVTGGEVQEARRLVRGSNTRWETRINPTSNADVTIVLPITTVCTADGAICTGDGRKLSNRLELTVSGPTSQQSSQPQENTPATGSPTISRTVQVGETLTAITSIIADTDGLANVSYSYQWIRNDGSSDTDIQDAAGSSYTLVDADEGKTIKVQVTFTDDAGHEETLTSAATASVEARPNSPATGEPTISGTLQVRETLSASTSGIADTDGLSNVSYSYQWIRNDGSSDTDIQDAAGSSYTLVDADEGKTIKVQVTFTDDAGHEETLTSAATASVEARPNSPATGEPTISGTLQVRETLSASTSGIADTDGLSNVSYSYQWIRNDGSSDTDIQDAAGSSYTLVDADEGKTIKVQVTFTDDAGHEETLTSAATASVEARPNSPATGEPTISGTLQVRETLSASTSGIADTDGLSNVSYSYQWIRNDGSSDTDIQDAAGSSYTLVDADEGKTIKVKVSFTDDAGHEETLTSAATASVEAAPEPITSAWRTTRLATMVQTNSPSRSGSASISS